MVDAKRGEYHRSPPAGKQIRNENLKTNKVGWWISLLILQTHFGMSLSDYIISNDRIAYSSGFTIGLGECNLRRLEGRTESRRIRT